MYDGMIFESIMMRPNKPRTTRHYIGQLMIYNLCNQLTFVVHM